MGARTRAGRWVASITLAMVKVLPEPVTPSSTWSRSLALTPATSSAMAAGWSPLGSNSETIVQAPAAFGFLRRGGRCGVNIGKRREIRAQALEPGARRRRNLRIAFNRRERRFGESAFLT